jgi:hypothetical protein
MPLSTEVKGRYRNVFFCTIYQIHTRQTVLIVKINIHSYQIKKAVPLHAMEALGGEEV